MADVDFVTDVVEKLNVAVDAFAGIVTVEGTVDTLLADLSDTLRPPVDALPFSVTVPVPDAPPPTVDGCKTRLANVADLIESVPVTEEPEIFAVTVAVTLVTTVAVVQSKLTVDEPPGTFADAGPPHAEELDFRLTTIPP